MQPSQMTGNLGGPTGTFAGEGDAGQDLATLVRSGTLSHEDLISLDWDVTVIEIPNPATGTAVLGSTEISGPCLIIGLMLVGANLLNAAADIGDGLRVQLFLSTDLPTNYTGNDPNTIPGFRRLVPNFGPNANIIVRNGLAFIPVRRTILDPRFFFGLFSQGTLGNTGKAQIYVYSRRLPSAYSLNTY